MLSMLDAFYTFSIRKVVFCQTSYVRGQTASFITPHVWGAFHFGGKRSRPRRSAELTTKPRGRFACQQTVLYEALGPPPGLRPELRPRERWLGAAKKLPQTRNAPARKADLDKGMTFLLY